ncbi:hypothetical protein BD626DRAFT_587542 [Schizophyllum amplum]|uniref:RNA-binding S4 domain-containing protein n=1 Tax=Schizophyllum amplum TaxID=97359 RepID=A0A550BTV5_9AGAR|nr:hypothetical protein BD626DRAFT_587542 [Auriculariopsis ampla]
MRDVGVYNVKRALPRMSWAPQNLYNLWQRTHKDGPKKGDILFNHATRTLFQQRWESKRCTRAYHGDFINETIFKRWYLPSTIPDPRPRRLVLDDKADLEEFAQRRQREKEYEFVQRRKGLPPVTSLMFTDVERRIDVLVFRACLAPSVYEARRLVVHGKVKLNGKQHSNANTRLAPGDMVTVDPAHIKFLRRPPARAGWIDITKQLMEKGSPTQLTPFWLPPYASPWMFIPAYIEASFATCSFVYVRHPTARPGYSEIPTPYDADGDVMRFTWEWYAKRRSRIRSKTQMARRPEDRALALLKDDSIVVHGRKQYKRELERRAREKVLLQNNGIWN